MQERPFNPREFAIEVAINEYKDIKEKLLTAENGDKRMELEQNLKDVRSELKNYKINPEMTENYIQFNFKNQTGDGYLESKFTGESVNDTLNKFGNKSFICDIYFEDIQNKDGTLNVQNLQEKLEKFAQNKTDQQKINIAFAGHGWSFWHTIRNYHVTEGPKTEVSEDNIAQITNIITGQFPDCKIKTYLTSCYSKGKIEPKVLKNLNQNGFQQVTKEQYKKAEQSGERVIKVESYKEAVTRPNFNSKITFKGLGHEDDGDKDVEKTYFVRLVKQENQQNQINLGQKNESNADKKPKENIERNTCDTPNDKKCCCTIF